MRLHLHLLRELLVGFAFAVGGMMVLALPALAVAAVARLAGVDTQSVLMFVPLLAAGLVPYVLPLGFLLAVVATFGRLAADNEWTAICMAGRSPLSMLLAPLLLGVLLSGFTHWLVAEQLPQTRRWETQYRNEAIRRTLTNLSPGRTELAIGKFYLSAAYRDGDDFLEALVYVPAREGKEPITVLADRVHFEFQDDAMLVFLENAHVVQGELDMRSTRPVVRLSLDELQASRQWGLASMRYRRSSELREALATGGFEGDPAREEVARFELQYRLALSSTFILFLVLGAPTGLALRRGTQLGALSVAVGYALLYYVLSMRLSKQLALAQFLPPAAGAWAVSTAGFAAGAWLLRRVMLR